MLKDQKKLSLLSIPFVFLIIYYQIFYSNYAYLDEIHQLWNNQDNSNFTLFHSQGRWLTGLMFQKFFSSMSAIEQIKYLRIFSLFGWIITTIVWASVFSQWCRHLNLPREIWRLSVLFVACCVPVAIYIGWASCFEVFLGIITGLVGSHLLYKSLFHQQNTIQLSNWVILGSLLAGLTSLFIYQTTFGIFLVPFILHYMRQKSIRPDKTVVIGVGFYLFTYVVYYLLFRQSLQAYDMHASDRTAISLDPLKKIAFFFSGPFQQAFSPNILFSPRSLFSQILCPLVLLTWATTVFLRNTTRTALQNLTQIAVFILLLVLLYLPMMIAAESFDSYRTLLAFNLVVFILVADALYYLFSRLNKQSLFGWVLATLLLITGFYNFNFQYIDPLKAEYRSVQTFMASHYKPSITKIHFIRPNKLMFADRYGTEVYKDEFGSPSTYRDWVPEPLMKQIIYELQGDRQKAAATVVVQYESESAFNTAKPTILPGELLVNMNEVFKEDHLEK